LAHDDVVRPVGSALRDRCGKVGTGAGQSALAVEDDDESLVLDDDEDDDASWADARALDNSGAAAKVAMAAVSAANGIRARMTRTSCVGGRSLGLKS
jgi:hypothetical protein